ncbi:MAG: hypothetical protein Q8O40_17865 [Chloroflexota bacterium]|nr:hypothetical protein [Chloroflexota bacterium]
MPILLVILVVGVALVGVVFYVTRDTSKAQQKTAEQPRKQARVPTIQAPDALPREVTFYIDKEQIEMLESASEFFPPQRAAIIRKK